MGHVLVLAEAVGIGTLAWETLKAIFFLLPLALSLWAFLDVARRPGWAWALAGRSRVTWLVLIALGVLTMIGGIVICLWYLLRVRPVIAAAEDGFVADPDGTGGGAAQKPGRASSWSMVRRVASARRMSPSGV